MEALLAQPSYYTLLGMANGNLRTASRQSTDDRSQYLQQAACDLRLLKRFEANVQELASEPEHYRTTVLDSVDATLQCIEAALEDDDEDRPACSQAHDPSLPPLLLERRSQNEVNTD